MAFHSAHLGINYAGTQHELGGCVADANELSKLFAPLVKSAGGVLDKMLEREATIDGVREFVADAVRRLKAGDTLFLSRSGHGTQIADRDGDERDRKDECFVCFDLELMSDDEFAVLLSERASGSVVVVFDDCCNSGGGSRFISSPAELLDERPRFIPGTLLTASHERIDRHDMPLIRGSEGVLHISACKPEEVAWDTGRHGAATLALLAALQKIAATSRIIRNWGDLFAGIASQLPTKQHPQTPTLTGDATIARLVLPWMAEDLPPAAANVLELGVSGVTAPDVLRFNGRTYRAE